MGDTSQPCVGKLNDTWNEEDVFTRQRLFDALEELGYKQGENMRVLEGHSTLYQDLLALKQVAGAPPFILNLCDEGFDNEALKELHVPAILEVLRLPYSGAGPNCLAYCYDKGLVNRSAAAIGIDTPNEITFLGTSLGLQTSDCSLVHQCLEDEGIGYPAFVKPLKGDNSLGITSSSIVRNRDDLCRQLISLIDSGLGDVVIQQYLDGTEYSVGIIGNEDSLLFLPILEVDYSRILERNLAPILGFESKWDPNSPYWTEVGYVRAKMHPNVEAGLHSACKRLWKRFGCADYARFDFRCDRGRGDGFDGLGGKLCLLEVNPNPGWCWDGKFAHMAKLDGISYSEMLAMILKAAQRRIIK